MDRCALFTITILLLSASASGAAEPAESAPWPKVTITPLVQGLDKPTHITHAGDGGGRIFVTEQRGRIMILRDNSLLPTVFLDIRDRVGCCGERGLLSVAFPPAYASKKHFYVNYTDRSGDTVVARYRVAGHPDTADPASEEVLLTIGQPYANHNGGQLAFGPDGFLYIGMGDGGSGGDPQNNGQKAGTLLGKILRIDVESGTSPYRLPPGNPFVNKKGFRPEIWALGLRNPWRFAFDRQTGDLFIADVGQNQYEEINVQPAGSRGGENYGWRIMEGSHCFRAKTCKKQGLVPPVAEYDHSKGCSVTGGAVYRGTNHPRLRGIYFYGDYCSGRVWGLRRTGGVWESKELLETGYAISTFGEDEDGAVYAADHGKGGIGRLE
ncbi:MAG: glucose dehydrogenase [Nitrospirae bacterium GWC2_57_13]|jgi:glucose/arabinose dehydrogenase|nr:MAG: glucose dehydrogenase [Nitrospirae bacterium GWC1_57_7]OGW29629.1 MAG: glucose dehydrogenase [Nitrospirae bacterium GWC2_57_13]HAS55184.1 glucose dehydrogenase [Nitrospiraceae bacterium]